MQKLGRYFPHFGKKNVRKYVDQQDVPSVSSLACSLSLTKAIKGSQIKDVTPAQTYRISPNLPSYTAQRVLSFFFFIDQVISRCVAPSKSLVLIGHVNLFAENKLTPAIFCDPNMLAYDDRKAICITIVVYLVCSAC
jgi:hypothetical protein